MTKSNKTSNDKSFIVQLETVNSCIDNIKQLFGPGMHAFIKNLVVTLSMQQLVFLIEQICKHEVFPKSVNNCLESALSNYRLESLIALLANDVDDIRRQLNKDPMDY